MSPAACNGLAVRGGVVRLLLVVGVFFSLPLWSAFSAPWPADSGTEIGAALPAYYEPSGIVWHDRLNMLIIVSDDGHVCQVDQEGGHFSDWDPGGDIEGIAIADGSTNHVYLGIEDPDSINEFDLAAGALTGKTWSLTSWMTGPSNSGLEGLTFVPNGHHPYAASGSGGLFYAGLQNDGRIYVFDVDLSTGGNVSYIDTITPVDDLTDISDLYYHRESGVLYAIFDDADMLLEMGTDGSVRASYTLPGNDQEGLTLMPSCPGTVTSIIIAEDSGPEVWRYGGYPVSCRDEGPDDPTPSPTESPTPTPTDSPTPAPTPQPTVADAPPGRGALRIEVSSTLAGTGDLFTMGIALAEDIRPSFDFYLLAESPHGVYTIFLNGEFRRGIHAPYRAIHGCDAPYAAVIWPAMRVPPGIRGAFTFYAVAVEAGRVPPVRSLAQLTQETPHVLSLDSRTVLFNARW